MDGKVTMKRDEIIHPQLYINGVLIEDFNVNDDEINIGSEGLWCEPRIGLND